MNKSSNYSPKWKGHKNVYYERSTNSVQPSLYTTPWPLLVEAHFHDLRNLANIFVFSDLKQIKKLGVGPIERSSLFPFLMLGDELISQLIHLNSVQRWNKLRLGLKGSSLNSLFIK